MDFGARSDLFGGLRAGKFRKGFAATWSLLPRNDAAFCVENNAGLSVIGL